MIKFENVNVTMQGKRILSDIKMKQLSEEKYIMILSILVYTLFSRMFDLMQPPAVKHSIAVV